MNGQPGYAAPAYQLSTRRGMLKTVLLSILTLGIYSIVFYSRLGNDMNLIATRYDGKKTMHYCLLCFVLAPVTLGIAGFVWFHKVSNRIGRELARRGLPCRFGAGNYWGWNILGILLLGIGPFLYLYQLCRAMNLLSADYNARG